MVNQNNPRKHPPIKLLKKKSYPTYQLYGIIDNGKIDVATQFKICVLETLFWLRNRFRELEIPEELNYPEPDNYDVVNMDDFKSFRIDKGYIVDVVYIKETEEGKKDSIWAFHLVEPDLGPDPGNENQKRRPVPGRVFETNIAFRIYNNRIECGFKTICSEPEGTTSLCEVFRISVVKFIVRNPLLGLKQIIPIIEEPHKINTTQKIKQFRSYINDKDRQLPLVILTEHLPEIDISALQKELFSPGYYYGNTTKYNIMGNTAKKENTPSIPINADNLIKYKMGYAQFGILSFDKIQDFNSIMGGDCSVSQGDIRIFYPNKFEEKSRLYKYDEYKSRKEAFIKTLEEELQEYPKGKNIDYGNVIFLNEARIIESQMTISMANSKDEIIKAIEQKLEATEQKYIEQINVLVNELEIKDRKNSYLEEEIKLLKMEKRNWQYVLDDIELEHQREKEQLQKQIDRMQQLLERPLKTEDIPAWADKYFRGKLFFHDRAVEEISKTPTSEVDMNLLCDAIEFLAHEYRDEFLGLIDREEKNRLCKLKYNRPFDVVPSGDGIVKSYPLEYKIKYGTGPNGRRKEVPLNYHLRVGVDNKNLLRIYFYFDGEKKLLVVGSLPKHLSTTSFR